MQNAAHYTSAPLMTERCSRLTFSHTITSNLTLLAVSFIQIKYVMQKYDMADTSMTWLTLKATYF